MSRYDTLGSADDVAVQARYCRGRNPLDAYYEHNANGEVVARPPIQPHVKQVLDRVCKRERDIEKFAEWMNNRK